MIEQITLTLPNIGCQGCMKKVVNALGGLSTVAIVHTDVPTKTVSLQYDGDQIEMEQVEATLRSIGHKIATQTAIPKRQ